jgi:CBS domain-containing protein
MNVKDLMTTNVRTCSSNDPITKAAQIMSEVNCGAVPIVDGDKVVGMVTDRDIVLRGVAKGKETNNCKCSDCMTTNVITCAPDMDAHRAADLMAEKQIRRLPVVENGRICGIVALGDMATVNIHVNEAGQALSQISEPAQPGAH